MPLCEIFLSLIVACGLTGDAFAVETLPIALLNLDKVFKSHKPFQDQLAKLQGEAKEVEQAVQARQAELETVNNQLRKTPQGTPDSTRLQIQLVKLQSEFQQYVNSERQTLQKKEATLLLGFHRQVDAVVSKYAKDRGIKLVLRQPEASWDESQSLAEIAKVIGRGILYEEGLDITEEILKALDDKTTNGAK